jgi:hypothetical protein
LFKLILPFLVIGSFSLLYAVIWALEKTGSKTFLAAFNSPDFAFFLMAYLSVVFYFFVAFIFIGKAIVSTILYRFVHNMPTGIFDRATLEAATKER